MKVRVLSHRFGRRFGLALVLAFVATASWAGYPFSDGGEAGAGQWSAAAPWALTTAAAHTGSYSFTDSPGTNYANDADFSLAQAASMDLLTAVRPRLSFWHKHAMENGFDFGLVEISLDGGGVWEAVPLASFTGGSDWRREEVDLTAFAGQTTVRLRFRLTSDSTITQDGWYLDDILVDEGPTAVVLDPITVRTANTLQLGWSASGDADFASYRVVRGAAAGFDWKTAYTVTTISAVGTLSYTDIALSPKSTYRYRVVVADTQGFQTPSNEVSGTTLAGMDFPFLDNGEGGTATWVADPPWGLSTEAAHSGATAWSDSPGGNYANNLSGASLTLSAPLNLSAATKPFLSFWHQYAFPGNDHGIVEISTNGGLNWTQLKDYTNGTLATWSHIQVDLSAYKVLAVLVRFRVTTDGATQGDGWQLDDIAVAEQPAVVPSPTLSGMTSHAMDLAWPQNAELNFGAYAIHYALATGVTLASPQAGTVADQATTTFTHSGLALNTQYFYRVYAVNLWGVYGPDSPTEGSAWTLNIPLPFVEDFEGSLENWNLTGAWSKNDVTTPHGGTYCLQDSPGNYLNSQDTTVTTSVSLAGTVRPLLTFWEKHDFQTSADYATVEVSPNGSTWYRRFLATGSQPGWRQQVIDLTEWRGQTNMRIRFHMWSDGGTTADGIYFDDLTVADSALPASQALPFHEDFESGMGDWLTSRWMDVAETPHGGAKAARSSYDGNTYDGENIAVLATPLNLVGTTAPQLVYWVRGHLYYRSYFRIHYSTNGGFTWAELASANINYDWNSDATWNRVQIDLTPYKSSPAFLLRIYTSTQYNPDEDIWVDDLSVEDLPPAVTLGDPVPHLKTMDLIWTESAIPVPDFDRYEVRRSTAAGVSLSSTLVTTTTDRASVTVTDTNPVEGLNIGTTYYYRVFSFDKYGAVVASNERSATTTSIPLPLVDPMENLNNWVRGANSGTLYWGPQAPGRDGSGTCMADSPSSTDYANSSDTWILTAVNLAGTVRPLLSFWESHAFQTNADYGYAEISGDGTNWSRRFVATGLQTDWRLQQLDLTEWRGNANVRVRFRVGTDGGTTNGGLLVDDVSIADAGTPTAQGIPFREDFESGIDPAKWYRSRWSAVAETPHGGTTCARSSYDGSTPDGIQILRLVQPLDLRGTTAPQLVYWVRGHLWYRSYFRIHYSTDGGVTWAELTSANINYDWNSDATWNRIQIDLSAYKTQANFHLQFYVSTQYNPDDDIWVDDVSVEELPLPVTLADLTPHLKTMDLSWSESAIPVPDFDRYEVRRSTGAGVSLSSALVTTVTDRAETTFTDTNPPEGLNIGTTYYYKVYTFDKYGAVVASNEKYAATTSIPLPLVDPMEDLGNWVRGANAGTLYWGPQAPGRDGSGTCMADTPGTDYANSVDNWIVTAVDLSTAVRPVLTFWERHYFQTNADYGVVEVSGNGSSWSRWFVATGNQSEWRQHQMDLSEWRGNANVRVRFRMWSDGGTTGDGLFVDDVSILDTGLPASQAPPFYEDFESGMGAWMRTRWSQVTETPHNGATCLRSSYDGNTQDGLQMIWASAPLDLTGTTSPQLVYWIRGHLWYRSYFRVNYSTNGGLTWTDLGGSINYDWGSDATWNRVQIDLSSLKTQTALLLRFYTSTQYNADEDIYLDDISVEDAPAAVVLNPVSPITTSTMGLSWTQSPATNFKNYLVYRANSTGVGLGSTLMATITDPATTSFADTGLQLGRSYYYRVYVVTEHDTFTPSNEVSATTLVNPMGLTEDFEATTDRWTFTGTWQIQPGAGQGGSAALVDSPGDYGCSQNMSATTAVDLRSTTWPVLTFYDHYTYESGNDWGILEIMTSEGAGWSRVYFVSGTRTEWRQIRVDLSPWKNNGNVWIRFRTTSNGCGVQGDGWTIDDISVTENAHAAIPYPYANSFDTGLGDFLQTTWEERTSSPKDGTTCALSTPTWHYPDAYNALVFAGDIDLSASVAPSLTLWVRGHLWYRSYFRVEVSTNGGVSWTDLPAFNINYDWNSDTTWVKLTTSLSSYKVAGLRIRIYTTSNSAGGDEDIYVDGLRIGEPAPTAPTPTAPANGSTVSIFRPTLTVTNAYDVQWDNLTYRFEIYSDEAMTQLVAQVPTVAETTGTTSWAVDTDLLNNQQYWWRCRASDGTNTGPWSSTANFFVVQVNNPPTVPQAVSPSNGASLWGTDAPVIWYPSTDPNAGDTITYDLQIDNNSNFASPEIFETGITENHGILFSPDATTVTVTLGSLTGYSNLQNLTVYYWRLRALDNRGAASSWTTESRYFLFGNDVQAPLAAWSAPDDGSAITASPATFTGTASDDFSGLDYVQVSVDGGATWQLASGAGSWSFSYAPVQNGDLEVLVRAADKAGNLSTSALRSFVVALPNIPVQLQAFPDNTTVTLTWCSPALTGVTGYNIYRSLTSRSGYTKVNAATVSVPVYRDANLANGTAYYYTVTALYGATESPFSEEAWCVTPATGRPPFVDDLMVRRSGDDLVLTWSPVTTDTGGGPYACPSYEVYDGGTGSYTVDLLGNANRLGIVSGETTFTLAGAALVPDPHYYHVTAADAGGNEGFWTEWFAEEDARAVAKTADWTTQAEPSASDGSCVASTTTGGEVTLSFSGTGAGLSAKVGPDQGIAQILLDGAPVATVDLYAAQPGWRQWVWGGDGFADTAHTVVVLVTGTKNASSSGTEVTVDRFVYGR